jgi:hypothetical protein
MTRFLTILLLVITTVSQAQELNCTVSVISPAIQNTEKRIFETLQNDLREFMNSTAWTSDAFAIEERIECSILITITEKISGDKFKATMQIQSSRPAYMTSYNTVLLKRERSRFRVQLCRESADSIPGESTHQQLELCDGVLCLHDYWGRLR